jgi:hypothetical protein
MRPPAPVCAACDGTGELAHNDLCICAAGARRFEAWSQAHDPAA